MHEIIDMAIFSIKAHNSKIIVFSTFCQKILNRKNCICYGRGLKTFRQFFLFIFVDLVPFQRDLIPFVANFCFLVELVPFSNLIPLHCTSKQEMNKQKVLSPIQSEKVRYIFRDIWT